MCSSWCKYLSDFGPHPIGMMADSHGDPEALGRAVRRLVQTGCRLLVHLGDICDSARPQTAAACVDLLARHEVLAVCGNNDHALIAAGTAVAGRALAWLTRLPLVIETPSAVFVHSRADIDRLGKSAMVQDMDDDAALRFLKQFPKRLLFRGHGHQPNITHRSGARLTHPPLPILDGPPAALGEGAVITCGSLLGDGSVWVWDPPHAMLRRLSLGAAP